MMYGFVSLVLLLSSLYVRRLDGVKRTKLIELWIRRSSLTRL